VKDASQKCDPFKRSDRSLGSHSLRLIVGYGFMEHAFAKLARGPEPAGRPAYPS
jgi:hypothetical protein